MIKILAVIAGASIIYFLIISPFIGYREKAENELKENRDRLEKLEKIYEEFKTARSDKMKYMSLLNQKESDTTSLIEQIATSNKIDKNIAYSRRSQSNIQNRFMRVTTDVKFEGVAIQSILKFIYDLENSNRLVKLNYIRIQQALKGTDRYDVIMKIDSFAANQQ